MKINLIIILLISFFSTGIYAQLDDNLKAKLYFTEAEKLFKQGDFKNSLVYVDKAEVTLGAPVARTLALRIKLAYNLGKFTQAKELFDTYTSKYMDGASKELNDEVLAMFINIEEAVEAEIKRQAFEKCRCSSCRGSGKIQNSKSVRSETETEMYTCEYCNGSGQYSRTNWRDPCVMCKGKKKREGPAWVTVYYDVKCQYCNGDGDGCKD